MQDLKATFGNMDIYLWDQLLKGRFNGAQRILDAGCGYGRNLVYFLQQGIDVYGVDANPEAIVATKQMAQHLNPDYPLDRFAVGSLENMPFRNKTFDVIVCNAVLHFAQDEAHFEAMLKGMWEVLAPEGHLLIRLASDIGIEQLVKPLGNRRFLLPDESVRFLVNQPMLLDYTQQLGGQLFEYIKTTNVQNLRCMTTWCLRKTI